jgi:sulfite reductase (NADPH) flavoprotein alpha-component
MSNNFNFQNFSPFDSSIEEKLKALIAELNTNQISWLGGYFTALANASNTQSITPTTKVEEQVPAANLKPKAILLYGTKTGNAIKVVNTAKSKLEKLDIDIEVLEMTDIDKNIIQKAQYIFIAVSTDGEGVPPPAAEGFYNLLYSKKAPKLDNIKYSVLGLGDSSYANFCQTGKDFDTLFEQLGAQRIVDRADADLDYEDVAENWAASLQTKVQELIGQNVTPNGASAPSESQTVSTNAYSKKNPYKAEILDRIKLNGAGSQKEVFHIELSLEDSGISYQPGDAIGIIPKNPEPLVNELLAKLKFDGAATFVNGHADTIKNHLQKYHEISLLSKEFLEKYNEKAQNDELKKIINNRPYLTPFLAENDVYDVLSKYPAVFSVDEFLPILPKLKPRLYSISSSALANPDEVHLTVAALKYQNKNREKRGVCSNMLADQITLDDTIEIYVDENPIFRLPQDDNTPIIMIGPGTGIAPFRAFVQERAHRGAKGKNWIFFGEQHFTTDFLYQTEWQNFLKKGAIDKFDVAFSRDQEEKIYVQHRIEQNAKEFYNWIESGAIIYVCGDKDKMAKDVLQSITNVVAAEARISEEEALNYVNNLRQTKRYLEDVY